MARKNFAATGSFIAEDRPRALDLLGFSSQLVFNTFHNGRLHDLEHGGDPDLAYAAARAHNRGMLEFCSVDPRLLPSLYVPLVDPEQAVDGHRRRARAGRRGAPGRVGLPAAVLPQPPRPVRCVGPGRGGGHPRRLPRRRYRRPSSTRNYFVNGKPVPPDFHGGEENFRSVDYMGIPVPPAQTLATLIFDGVLERFPDLHVGVIEQGAIWVPSWLRQMESAFEAFRRHEERLQALSLRPSDYVHRQVRFTPYPTEDVGWIVAQAGPDLVLFSSDYPHVEGGRKPLERFEASLGDASEDVRRQFYADNFLFLMGSAAAAAGGLSTTAAARRNTSDRGPVAERERGCSCSRAGQKHDETTYEVTKTDEEWREQLPPDRYAVLRRAGTEPAWSGELLHVDGRGCLPLRRLRCRAVRHRREVRVRDRAGPASTGPARPGPSSSGPTAASA